MQTQSHKFTIEVLSDNLLPWFVEIAAVNMLVYELKRPELINLEHMYKLGMKMLEDRTGWVVKQNNEPVGALGSLLVPNTFNPKLITLAEIFWYVLPEYRKTRAGTLLFKAFDALADSVADEGTLSLLNSSEVNVSSLSKRGFNLEEMSFRKVYHGSY